jgi:hypothetical protein
MNPYMMWDGNVLTTRANNTMKFVIVEEKK